MMDGENQGKKPVHFRASLCIAMQDRLKQGNFRQTVVVSAGSGSLAIPKL
jgi:hypothetical protein